MSIDITGARTKYRWACKHVQLLQARLDEWTEEHPKPVVLRPEYDRKNRRLVFWVAKIEPFPPCWGLIAGDALSNFRQALDHAAWELVKRVGEPDAEKEYRFGFPILTPVPGEWTWREGTRRFNHRAERQLPGIPEKHLAVVRRHQPYLRRGRADQHPLAVLQRLVNKDKHRELVLLVAGLRAFEHRVDASAFYVTRRPRPRWPTVLKAGAKAISIYGTLARGAEPDVDVEYDFATSIAFEDAGRVLEELERIRSEVIDVLDDIEQSLSSRR